MTPEAERQLSEEVARKLGWWTCNDCHSWMAPETGHQCYGIDVINDAPFFRSPEIVCAMIEWLFSRPIEAYIEMSSTVMSFTVVLDDTFGINAVSWKEALARAFLSAES